MISRIFKDAGVFLLAALLSLGGASCGQSTQLRSETYYDMFDTFVTIMAYGEGADLFEENCEIVKGELYECTRLFDIYREYEGINNIATVNKNAALSPVKVDERIISLLEFSQDMHSRTGGAVNIAMGSVLSLWHEAREANEAIPLSAPPPSEAELDLAAAHTDIKDIIIDRENMTVYLADPDMSIDVGAVAKGYAADLAAQKLRERGIKGGYAINLGGNVMTLGEKFPGEPWRISVRSPYTEYSSSALAANIRDSSLVTSGNYERKFEYGGKSYHHIIDPKTLMPSEHFDAVSVTGASSAVCDALSTALFCMSYEDGLQLLGSFENVEAVWIADGQTHLSEYFPVAGENK